MYSNSRGHAYTHVYAPLPVPRTTLNLPWIRARKERGRTGQFSIQVGQSRSSACPTTYTDFSDLVIFVLIGIRTWLHSSQRTLGEIVCRIENPKSAARFNMPARVKLFSLVSNFSTRWKVCMFRVCERMRVGLFFRSSIHLRRTHTHTHGIFNFWPSVKSFRIATSRWYATSVCSICPPRSKFQQVRNEIGYFLSFDCDSDDTSASIHFLYGRTPNAWNIKAGRLTRKDWLKTLYIILRSIFTRYGHQPRMPRRK